MRRVPALDGREAAALGGFGLNGGEAAAVKFEEMRDRSLAREAAKREKAGLAV